MRLRGGEELRRVFGQRVEGAGDAVAALLQDVDVLHGGAQLLVAQEPLDGAPPRSSLGQAVPSCSRCVANE